MKQRLKYAYIAARRRFWHGVYLCTWWLACKLAATYVYARNNHGEASFADPKLDKKLLGIVVAETPRNALRWVRLQRYYDECHAQRTESVAWTNPSVQLRTILTGFVTLLGMNRGTVEFADKAGELRLMIEGALGVERVAQGG
jgi:hypothetical protein